jgi:hypothetical protein
VSKEEMRVGSSLPEDKLRAAFAALVKVQDDSMKADDSRYHVALRLGVRLEDVRVAEQFGMENSWPPLN